MEPIQVREEGGGMRGGRNGEALNRNMKTSSFGHTLENLTSCLPLSFSPSLSLFFREFICMMDDRWESKVAKQEGGRAVVGEGRKEGGSEFRREMGRGK